MISERSLEDRSEGLSIKLKRCRFHYVDGDCQNEPMWGADYCLLHIDNKYAEPDAVAVSDESKPGGANNPPR